MTETGFDTVSLAFDRSGVATLCLEREDRHNAMNATMVEDLEGALARIRAESGCRVVVMTGAGKSFCAGGDLDWMRRQFAADRDSRRKEALRFARLLRDWNELPVPVIGRINGPAFGGGMGLVAICDCAIAGDTAQFGFTETSLGLIPATIGPFCIARMGEAAARRVFMSSRRFSARSARELGLVAMAVPTAELDDTVRDEVQSYLSCAPQAVAAAKAHARSLGPVIDDAVLESAALRLANCWESPEIREGIAAFLEKRKPSWAD